VWANCESKRWVSAAIPIPPSSLELLFVLIASDEELVEGAFAVGWEYFTHGTRYGLVAAV